jgi:hypothetical protein
MRRASRRTFGSGAVAMALWSQCLAGRARRGIGTSCRWWRSGARRGRCTATSAAAPLGGCRSRVVGSSSCRSRVLRLRRGWTPSLRVDDLLRRPRQQGQGVHVRRGHLERAGDDRVPDHRQRDDLVPKRDVLRGDGERGRVDVQWHGVDQPGADSGERHRCPLVHFVDVLRRGPNGARVLQRDVVEPRDRHRSERVAAMRVGRL